METQEILKNIDFPVIRDDIIEQARKSGAISDILWNLACFQTRNTIVPRMSPRNFIEFTLESPPKKRNLFFYLFRNG